MVVSPLRQALLDGQRHCLAWTLVLRDVRYCFSCSHELFSCSPQLLHDSGRRHEFILSSLDMYMMIGITFFLTQTDFLINWFFTKQLVKLVLLKICEKPVLYKSISKICYPNNHLGSFGRRVEKTEANKPLAPRGRCFHCLWLPNGNQGKEEYPSHCCMKKLHQNINKNLQIILENRNKNHRHT